MSKRKIIEETTLPCKKSKYDISENDSLSETWRTWEDNLTRLIAYRDAHDGDCNVPQTWKDDPQLAIWVKNMKQHFRKYKADPVTSSLNTERIAKLQKIGAITSWSNATQYAFKEKLKCLIKYRDAHDGDCNVPQIWKYDQKLANWVKLQKTEFYKYKNDPKTSKLTPERISLLEEAGAIKSWLLKRRLSSRTWEENLTRLIAYRDAHDGNCNVPQSYKKDPQLGIWVMTQKKYLRNYYNPAKKSVLSADQVAELQKIGAITSWSSTAHRKWEDNLKHLIAYRDKHNGCCNVPLKWEKDPRLANWVKFHKTQFRKYKEDPATSQLNPKRISTLKEIGAIKSWFPSKKSEEEEICDKTEEESDDETEEESEEILVDETEDESEDESEETSEIETEEESDKEPSLDEKIVFLKNDIEKIREETKSIPIVTSL
mgnify:CR=1 FL=1